MRNAAICAAAVIAGTAGADTTFVSGGGLIGSTDVQVTRDSTGNDTGITNTNSNEPTLLDGMSFSSQTGGGVIDDQLLRNGSLVAETIVRVEGGIFDLGAGLSQVRIDLTGTGFMNAGYSGSIFSDLRVIVDFELDEESVLSSQVLGDPHSFQIFESSVNPGSINGDTYSAGRYTLRLNAFGFAVQRNVPNLPDIPMNLKDTTFLLDFQSTVIPLPGTAGMTIAGMGLLTARRRR